MGLKSISRTEVQAITSRVLHLNGDAYDFNAEETLACAIRRVASFLTPCSANTLISAIAEPMKGIVENLDLYRIAVEETLESLIGFGDLLEIDYGSQDQRGYRGPTIYAAPPCFIRRRSGALILLGITPDSTTLLSKEMQDRVMYRRYIRLLPPDLATNDIENLKALGYFELSFDTWSKLPKEESVASFVKKANFLLNAAPPAGSLGDLEIIGPWTQELFYKGRWVKLSVESGRFVGRRKQAHGAAIWGYYDLANGEPVRFVDLPFNKQLNRGCDEAWRLQAALDCSQGMPQLYRIREGAADYLIFDFFAPIPMWASRRWDVVGELVPKKNCLFSYAFSVRESHEEMAFIEKYLWLQKA